jgi:hypothetical protein
MHLYSIGTCILYTVISPCIAEIESCGFTVGQEGILSVADLVMKYILMIAG